MDYLSYYLLIDHISIQNANAISSPLTYGFPAITGFLGAVHALNRKIRQELPIFLDGVLIACHDYEVQAYRPHRYADYRFSLTRNPIAKDGSTRSIIEEGRVHLDVSLLIEVKMDNLNSFTDIEQKAQFEQQIKQMLYQQRVAGGQVISIGDVTLYSDNTSEQELCHRLLPAYVLCEARHELDEITAQLKQTDPMATELDALIETAKIHYHPQGNDIIKTTTVKQGRGWLVPLHLGYQAISPLFSPGQMENVRSDQHPTQFVESLYGLGKWIFPLRLKTNLSSAFWRYKHNQLSSNETNIYLVTQEQTD